MAIDESVTTPGPLRVTIPSLYVVTERAGGAILVSGNVDVTNCVLANNKARLGPAIYNTVAVTLESTDVCDNQLLCDDGSFLDWNLVSTLNLRPVMERREIMSNPYSHA